jgi:hypothetical protein
MRAKFVNESIKEKKSIKIPELDDKGKIKKSAAPSNIKDCYSRGNKNVNIIIPKKLLITLSKDTSNEYLNEDKIDIYLVNGTVIRDNIDPDYTEGGHGYIYPNYIPENEIWIDMIQDEKDLYSSIEHEIHERIDMKFKKLSYDEAHDNALKWEEKIRHGLQVGFLGESFEPDKDINKRIKEFSKACASIKK